MKPQTLSVFDVYFLAAELNNSFAGKTIGAITARPNHVCLEIGEHFLGFIIVAGTPYIISADKCPGGRTWLPGLRGGHIEHIEQQLTDRLISFKIASFDRLGKRKNFTLFFELYKNGNIILTDASDRIVSSFRRISLADNRYIPANPSSLNILGVGETSSLTAEEIDLIKSLNIFRYSEKIGRQPEDFLEFILQLKKHPQPNLIEDESADIVGFSVYGPPFVKGLTGRPQRTLMATVTKYVERLLAVPARKTDYRKQIKRVERKLQAMHDELAAASEYRKLRLYGELILANLAKLKKGQVSCELANPYDKEGTSITIPLDGARNPQENADDYFAKARKLETSIPIIKKRLQIQQAKLDELKLLEQEGQSKGTDEEPTEEQQPARQKSLPFRQFDLGGGWKIYVGKSAKSNDELTFGFARKDDIWFHAWQAFGSHLILRGPQKGAKPGLSLLTKAASLAAFYSKAKTSSKVPVVYTEVRYIRKVKKVPGKVTYTNEKELMVEPHSPEEILGK